MGISAVWGALRENLGEGPKNPRRREPWLRNGDVNAPQGKFVLAEINGTISQSNLAAAKLHT